MSDTMRRLIDHDDQVQARAFAIALASGVLDRNRRPRTRNERREQARRRAVILNQCRWLAERELADED